MFDIGTLVGRITLQDDASASLKTFASNVDKVDSSLTSVGAEDFGRKVTNFIKNPVTSAEGALSSILDTLGPVGVAVSTLGSVAVVAGAGLFKLAEGAAKVGASLDDMSDKTGLSVPMLSRLSNASQVIGADMGQLTDVVFKLQRGISENSDAFQAGLGKMGLSTDSLRAVGPDRYLELITTGLKSIADPSERAAAGTAVLGREYKSVAAALMDLDAGFKATADLSPWTAEQAKRAEEFEQQIASIKMHVSAAAVALGNELIPAVSGVISGIERIGTAIVNVSGIPGYIKLFDALKGVMGETALAEQSLGASTDTANRLWASAGATAESVAKQMLTLGYNIETVTMHSGLGADAVSKLSNSLTAQKNEAAALDAVWTRLNALEAEGIPSIEGLSDSTKGYVHHLQELHASVTDITAATGASAIQQNLIAKEYDAAADAATKAAKAVDSFAVAQKEINQVGKSWTETLNTIDGAVVEAIKFYLEAGVSQKTLADYYGLTDRQVKSVEVTTRGYNKSLDTQKPKVDELGNAATTMGDKFVSASERAAEAQARHNKELAEAAAKAKHLDDVLKGFVTGWFDIKGNKIDQITTDRYTPQEITAVAAQLHTTADEISGMLANIGTGTLDDILKAGRAAQRRGASQADIDMWRAMGGQVAAAVVSGVQSTLTSTTSAATAITAPMSSTSALGTAGSLGVSRSMNAVGALNLPTVLTALDALKGFASDVSQPFGAGSLEIMLPAIREISSALGSGDAYGLAGALTRAHDALDKFLSGPLAPEFLHSNAPKLMEVLMEQLWRAAVDANTASHGPTSIASSGPAWSERMPNAPREPIVVNVTQHYPIVNDPRAMGEFERLLDRALQTRFENIGIKAPAMG